MDFPELLNRKQASQYLLDKWVLRFSSASLAKAATRGGGPQFLRRGRFVVYTREHLDEFAKSKASGPFRSTSEYPRKTDEGEGR